MHSNAAPITVVIQQDQSPRTGHGQNARLRAIPFASSGNMVIGHNKDAAAVVTERVSPSGSPPRPSLVDRHVHPPHPKKQGKKNDRLQRRLAFTPGTKKAAGRAVQTVEPQAPRYANDFRKLLASLFPAYHLGQVNAMLKAITLELTTALLDRRTATADALNDRVEGSGYSISRRSLLKFRARALWTLRNDLVDLKRPLQQCRKGEWIDGIVDEQTEIFVHRTQSGKLYGVGSKPHDGTVKHTTATLVGGLNQEAAGLLLRLTPEGQLASFRLPVPSTNGVHVRRPGKIVSTSLTVEIKTRTFTKKEAAEKAAKRLARQHRLEVELTKLAGYEARRVEKLDQMVLGAVEKANILRTAPARVKAKAKMFSKMAALVPLETKMGTRLCDMMQQQLVRKADRKQKMEERRACEAAGLDYDLLTDDYLTAEFIDDYRFESEERITASYPPIATKKIPLRMTDEELVAHYSDA